MVEALELSDTDRVLDVACGTGIVARVARRRVAHAVGVDVSAGMLGVAGAADPSIDWREGNATALPLRRDEHFDAVICQQGLQFFADKPAAAAQMRLALAGGGTLAISVWRSDDEMPFLRELRRVAEGHLGPIADQRYAFGDAAVLETLLRDAGLRAVRSKPVSRTVRFKDGASFLRLNAMAFVGMSRVAASAPEQERQRLVEAIADDSASAARSHTEGGELSFETVANVAIATG